MGQDIDVCTSLQRVSACFVTVSCDGATLVGFVELLPDATGIDLLTALRKGFCADDDMETAILRKL